jgi:hypothetical protein
MKLSKEDVAQFYRLMWGLQFFVGRQRRLIPEVNSLPEYLTLPSATKIIVRDAVWANADLIDAYVAKNPEGLSAAELNVESERIVAEIGKMSEKIRGGTVIQSAALGVLRAGAKVAQSAAQEPDDLDELSRLGRQVQSALKRLQTALERAGK